MGKVEDKKRRKQIALLRSGYALFAEKGVERTTVLEIALKAGLAKGTFYLYFEDKYAMRDAIIYLASNKVLKEALQEVVKRPAGSFEDLMVAMVDEVMRTFAERRDLLEFMARNLNWCLMRTALLTPAQEGVKSLLGDGMDIYGLFKQAMADRHVRARDPLCLLYLIVQLVGSTAKDTILHSDPLPLDEFRPLLDAAVRGIIRSQLLDSGDAMPQGALEEPDP